MINLPDPGCTGHLGISEGREGRYGIWRIGIYLVYCAQIWKI